MNSLRSVKRPFAAMLALLFGLPLNGWSCEPIIPLYQLLNGSSLVGPALVMHSLSWLMAAVSIKCGAFVFLERRLPWRKAVPRDGGEESSPAPSERNAKNEHDRKPHLHWMPRNRSATR
jgi:hypothetical protein